MVNNEATDMIRTMRTFIDQDDADGAWNAQEDFARVWNNLPPDSPERVEMAALWKEMMIKWH